MVSRFGGTRIPGGGLEKTVGTDALKVALRLRVPGQGTDLFHLDQLDLCRDMERRRFIDRAARKRA